MERLKLLCIKRLRGAMCLQSAVQLLAAADHLGIFELKELSLDFLSLHDREVSLFIYLFIYLFCFTSFYLFCLFVCLLFVCLFVGLFIFLVFLLLCFVCCPFACLFILFVLFIFFRLSFCFVYLRRLLYLCLSACLCFFV